MEIIVYRYLWVLPIVGLCQFLNEQFVFLRCGLVSGKEIENNLHFNDRILRTRLYQAEIREILPSLIVEILHGAISDDFVSWEDISYYFFLNIPSTSPEFVLASADFDRWKHLTRWPTSGFLLTREERNFCMSSFRQSVSW